MGSRCGRGIVDLSVRSDISHVRDRLYEYSDGHGRVTPSSSTSTYYMIYFDMFCFTNYLWIFFG